MKKFFNVCASLLLGVMLFAFAGCGTNGSKVFNYLKSQQNFVGNPGYNGGSYTVSFTVNEDLAYSLSVSDNYYSALKNYSAEGTKMEYLGQCSDSYESTWLGVTTHHTRYTHVIKLPEATVEINGNSECFYLLANSDSKRGDITMIKLAAAPATYGEGEIANLPTGVYGGYALKKA